MGAGALCCGGVAKVASAHEPVVLVRPLGGGPTFADKGRNRW